MKHLNNFCFAAISALMLFSASQAASQESKVKLGTGADIVSTYIWRGTAADQSVNIQPNLTLSWGNFSLGTWASTNFTGSYKEIDLFASYAFKGFTLTLTDYTWSPSIDNTPYFDYNSETTGHYIETALMWKGPEAFPLTVNVATMVYGADRALDEIDPISLDTTYMNLYSTYLELAYALKIADTKCDIFLGMTPDEGLYGTGAGVVNMGVTGYRSIKFSDSFSLPVKGSLIFNPQASKAFFVFGITL